MAVQRRLELPEKYCVTENEPKLTYERLLLNAIIELCEGLKLGVKAGNIESCNRLVLAPCLDESQVISASLQDSESYEWHCPSYFKDAIKAHQRKKLAPTTAGGGRRKRKGRPG